MSLIKKLSSPIFIFLLIIINIPKFNIISFGSTDYGGGDYSQGIRLDDILILIFVFFNIQKASFSRDSILIFSYVTFAYLFSFFHQINSIHFGFVQFHYVRFLEYFFLYSVLIKVISKDDIIKVVIGTMMIQFFYGTFEYYNLPNQIEFTKDSRAKGSTAGPWEFINIIAMCYFILADYYRQKRKFINILFFYSLTWSLILISFSRMTAIAFLLLLMIKNIKYSIIIFATALLIFLLNINLSLFQNIDIGYFSLKKTFTFLKDFGMPILNNFTEGNYFLGRGGTFYDTTAQNYSASMTGRLQQWGRYLTTFNNSELKLFAYIFGNGPGSGSIINDGMYIKLFVDFGLVGLLLYLYIIIKKFIFYKRVRQVIIYISIVCLTLDFYWPTKIAYSFILLMIYFKKTETKVETGK